jgi:predicted ATPase
MARPHPLTESWERRHFYESLNAAFAKATKPLLLLIDDLQWCDQDSFEWLHSLFRAEAARGILVLGTLRSEETGRDHPFIKLESDLRQSGLVLNISLAPLGLEETTALASQVAGAPLDAAALAHLYGATKGHPLFIVETVRAGPDSTLAAAPPRIHAVIAARLAQLTASAYELAGYAGAIGRSFSFDLLAKATDWDEDSLSRALDELWQRRIVAQASSPAPGSGESRSVGDAQYDFTHDRLREVAYAELTPVRRRFLHRRIARAMEELHASDLDAIDGQLAAHYEAAGMAGEAVDYYRRAASVARRLFADGEAASMLRRALVLCREFPPTAKRDQLELELLVTLGAALVTNHGYAHPEAGETYARALQLSVSLGEKKHRFHALSGSWVFHVVRGQLETSRALGQQFLDLANGEPALVMAGNFLLGSSTFQLGQLTASHGHLVKAMAADGGPSQSALSLFAGTNVRVFSQSYGSHTLWQLGWAEQAAAMSEEAVAGAEAFGDPFSHAIALAYRAMLHLFRRESPAALRWAEQASAICRKHAFAYYLSMTEIVAGWALAMEGDTKAGLTRLRQGLDSLKATGAEVRLPFYHGLLAEVCALSGQAREALANIASGLAFLNKNSEMWAASDLHRIHGDLLETSNPAGAEASYRRAIETGRQTGGRMFQLRAATCLCRLPLSAASMAEAREALEALYRQFTEGFETYDLREAERQLPHLQNVLRTPHMAS